VVEAYTNLAAPTWLPLQTNSLVNGWFDFRDAQWTAFLNRFYRVRQQ
jgi:hypothetical protein